jgi:hypothetical protein
MLHILYGSSLLVDQMHNGSEGIVAILEGGS